MMSEKRSKAYGILGDGIKVESSKNIAISEGRKSNKPSTMEKTKLPWRPGQSVPMPSLKRVAQKAMVKNSPSRSIGTLRTEEMEKR